MGRAARWMRLGLLGALVSSLLLPAGCILFNIGPTAVITAIPLAGESPLIVTFDGTQSTDPEGDIAAYRWDFGDGTQSTEAAPHHTFLALTETKVFIVTLRVTDELGATDTVSQSIEVRVADANGGGTGAPIARITADKRIGTSPLTVTFHAGDSEPGSGSITQIRWDFGDDTGATGFTVSHTFDPEATETFTVTAFVGNTEGLITAAQLAVIVVVPDDNPGGDDPVASIDATDPLLLYDSPTPASTPTLYEVTFSPAGSYADAGQEIDYYAWDFGDGEGHVSTTDIDVTHVYELSAPSRTFVVRLFVYDDQGAEGTAIVNMTLEQPTD